MAVAVEGANENCSRPQSALAFIVGVHLTGVELYPDGRDCFRLPMPPTPPSSMAPRRRDRRNPPMSRNVLSFLGIHPSQGWIRQNFRCRPVAGFFAAASFGFLP